MEKFLMIDTETTNDIDCPICYDVGFAVIDKNGKVYETGSYVVADVFLDNDLMKTAFFAEKIPEYWKQIKDGSRLLRRWKTIKSIVYDVMKQYDVHSVVAHNMRFDYRSTVTTQRYLTSSKYRYFFPYGTKFFDTLKMSREIFKDDNNYKNFCEENNFLCKNGSPRYTAEILYRYLNKNKNFSESHTALEDVMIEKEIFTECLNRNPEINGCLWE